MLPGLSAWVPTLARIFPAADADASIHALPEFLIRNGIVNQAAIDLADEMFPGGPPSLADHP